MSFAVLKVFQANAVCFVVQGLLCVALSIDLFGIIVFCRVLVCDVFL